MKENYHNIPNITHPGIKKVLKMGTVIGFIGNIGQWYDYDLLLKAAQSLEGIQFIVVGEGSQKKRLREKIQELGLDNVHLFGSVSLMQALSIMSHCDFTIIPLNKGPAYEISLPLRIFDSLALGIPVILSAGKEATCFIEKSRGGYKIDRAEDIRPILHQYQNSPEKFEERKNYAREYVNQYFDRSKMAENYLEFMNKIIEKTCL